MKHLLLLALACILVPSAVCAQATPAPAASPATTVPESAQEAILPNGVVAAPTKAATPAPAASTALIALAPETPAANPNAIKVKAESTAGRLTVKTDNPGPTRIEVTDGGGRPVLTHTMMNGQMPAVLNVSKLPAGAYIVRCTAYEKTGMRRVMIGQ